MDRKFLQRTEALLGKESIDKLIASKVAIFGLGGVGGATCEVLARSGVGTFLIVDFDTIDITNLNRQIISTIDTLGKYKSLVQKERILSINPDANIFAKIECLSSDNVDLFELEKYDYVVDAIDDVQGKIALIKYCKDYNIPIISAMGAGNKIDPLKLKVADIYKTEGDPLARKMRKSLRDLNIDSLKVVYSDESPNVTGFEYIPSVAFITNLSGLIVASEVIKDLIK